MKPPNEKRWVVRDGDGVALDVIVTKLGADDVDAAIAEGRVFVGRRRATSRAEAVRPGDVVRVTAPSRGRDVVIAHDERGIVAAIKPSGIPTVPDHAGSAHAFVVAVARATSRDVSELHVTSRLDRDVSGVVLFATDETSERVLRDARERGDYVRRYLAIAGASPASAAPAPGTEGTWDAPIGRGKDARHRAANGPDGKASTTRYRVVAAASRFALLAVEPITGRTHQIRVHSAHAGLPLVGDRDYGGDARITLPTGRVVALARIALHAARVTVPAVGEGGSPLVVDAPIPEDLKRLWAELGGDAEAWNTALTCSFDRSS